VVKKFFSLFFVMLLSAPVVLMLVGHLRGNPDNTVRQGFPAPEASVWRDRSYYQSVEGWFQESLPTGQPLKFFHNWLNFHLFSATSTAGVHIGIHGWLYPEESSVDRLDPAIARQAGRRLLLNLHAAEKMITATGRRFLFTVAPGKAAIYPEYVGSGAAAAGSPVYKALLDAHARYPLAGFIRLEPALIKAKLNGIDVYHKQSRLWSCEGAAAAAEQILDGHEPAGSSSTNRSAVACAPPDNALYRLLLGEDPQESLPLAGHAAGPHAVTGPMAVVYGDHYLYRLLPFITHAFNALEIIDAIRQPTFGRNVMAKAGDLIILESAEDRLGRIDLNLESLYTATAPQLQGLIKQDIAMAEATPVSRCALDITPEGLQIRSSGETAFFSLPPLAGSTDNVFRMVKLTFSPDHQGRVTVRTRPDGMEWVRRTLNRETRHLIVPLPFEDSVEIEINPSEHPGVFTLEQAEWLSFYGKNPPPLPAVPKRHARHEDIGHPMAVQPIRPPVAVPVLETPAQPAVNPTDAIPDLTLTDIEQGRIFQRRGKDADIVVTGTYTGASGPVEARVVADGSDVPVVPWTVVDGSPEKGLFTGIIRQVPQGGWYRLQVRSGITPRVIKAGRSRWGVGMLIACIGQSNMREWFYTGSDHQPSPLVMLYREGQWLEPMTAGNGALAAGNRLAAALKIPVGLLDYSVNGSGLTAKAEWGTGFWLDTGPGGIYRRWVDGVNTTGGSVEYVVWMQGEADAARGTVSREEYRTALERLVDDQIRLDIKNGSARPQLPFLIIPLVKRPTGKNTSCQWIRSAQMDALKTIDECHLAALSLDLENRGRQHLAPASYTTLGIRTAQTILYLLGKAAYHRGPAVTAVTRESDRTVDIAIRHRGGTDFTPGSSVTGFEVLAGEQLLPIAAASRRDSSTIRIELEDAVAVDFSVRYLYGAHPDTSNPVRDNTELRLPLEPFSQ
jgi:hypothetical protein